MLGKRVVLLKEGWSKEKCRIICNDILFKEIEAIDGFFRLNREVFVGIYTSSKESGRITIYSCPKYFDFDLEPPYSTQLLYYVKKHMDLIYRVIEQLRKDGKEFQDSEYQFSPYDNYSERRYVNAYELADFILADYSKYGLFHNRNKMQRVKNNGRTIWGKTINKLQPMIDNDEVLYIKTISQYRTKDYSQLLSHIHAYIVNKSAGFLQPLGNYENLELPENKYGINENLEEYYDYILTQLSYVYNAREIILLKALASWCSMSNFYKAFGGVTYFENVWEYVTKEVWGNIDITKSDKPYYFIENKFNEELVLEGTGNEIPDIIRVAKCNSNLCLGIFDAKYYYPHKILRSSNDKMIILGAPANSDVVKQIAYYNNFRRIYGDKIHYANAFLVPDFSNELCNDLNVQKLSSGELYKYRGYVESGINTSVLDMLKLNGYNTEEIKSTDDIVTVFTVNPEELYRRYLSNTIKIPDNIIYEDFIKKHEELLLKKQNECKNINNSYEIENDTVITYNS